MADNIRMYKVLLAFITKYDFVCKEMENYLRFLPRVSLYCSLLAAWRNK
jgi:hypothetical protein